MTVLDPGPGAPRLLLVEDDDGDALLVEELLIDAGEPFAIERVTSVAAALSYIDKVDCAIVDLSLPDAAGLSALSELQARAPELPIVVLTGLVDRNRGIESLVEGAQDYLVKGEVRGPDLARSVRYAIERRRTERDARLLLVSQHRADENDRLARGLLPQLHVDGPVEVATRYRPGADATLGGDFFDAWLADDGRLRAVIGDVCGHGPAEAAVGVALRIAWRTMTLGGASAPETLAAMERVLIAERDERQPFATVCDITIDLPAQTLTTRLHGHPPPVLLHPEPVSLGPIRPAVPLGLLDEPVEATPVTVPLAPGWSVLLFTDGLYEGRAGEGRLGESGLRELLRGYDVTGPALLDELVVDVQDLNGGDLDDDLALLLLSDRR